MSSIQPFRVLTLDPCYIDSLMAKDGVRGNHDKHSCAAISRYFAIDDFVHNKVSSPGKPDSKSSRD